jgi:tRNA (cmo5U34)-methyltransferase
MSEGSTIRCYDRHAAAYDLYQSKVVPEYETAIETTALIVDRLLGKSPQVLDLGCGTGNASAAILILSPGARIFLLDGSASMVAAAEAKVTGISPSSLLGSKVADLASKGWDEGLAPGSFDAVVSTLVLEHLDFDSYRAVLRSCFGLLRPGGWLLAVEGYAEEESDMLGWFEEMMAERRSLISEPDLSDFISNLRAKDEVHHRASKGQKADWWREAGFERIHLLWQYLCIALMAGRKPQIR